MSEYYAVVRSTDHLAHYGVKGMKWGVRKAIARGNQKALDRHFRKAAKKLAKLQDIGLNPGKYAAKSAAYGVAAAGTGTIAVKAKPFKINLPGTHNVTTTNIAGQTLTSKVANRIDVSKKGLRIGAALATAGLAAKSAQNAYRAKNSAKYRKKAYEFKNAMDSAFSGTKYSKKYVAPPKAKKRRTTVKGRRNQNG